ncbi:MAG: hypothetical protein V3575_06320 [Candidatus Absconditabacteria bacterium]
MKKLSIVLLLSLFLGGCLFNSTEKAHSPNNASFSDNNNHNQIGIDGKIIDVSKGEIDISYLNGLFLPTTFSQKDLDDFQSKLVNYENAQDLNEDETIKMGVLYDNIGYTGKALVVYFDYMRNTKTQSYAFHLNLSRFLGKICNIDTQLNYKYCKKGIQSYYNLIEGFVDNSSYTELVQLLIDMGELNTASKVYELYIDKTGLEDESLVNQLK